MEVFVGGASEVRSEPSSRRNDEAGPTSILSTTTTLSPPSSRTPSSLNAESSERTEEERYRSKIENDSVPICEEEDEAGDEGEMMLWRVERSVRWRWEERAMPIRM